MSYNEFLEYPRARAVIQAGGSATPIFTTAERVTNIIVKQTGVADTLLISDNDGSPYFNWALPATVASVNIDVRFFAHNGLKISTIGGAAPDVTVFWVYFGPGADKTPE